MLQTETQKDSSQLGAGTVFLERQSRHKHATTPENDIRHAARRHPIDFFAPSRNQTTALIVNLRNAEQNLRLGNCADYVQGPGCFQILPKAAPARKDR